MRFILAFIISAAIIAGGGVAFIYSGLYDVAATSPHGGIVAWMLSTTSENSIERRAKSIQVPVLTGDQRIIDGAGEYDKMCAGCHGAPGRKPGPVGKGLKPDPPELDHAADEMSAAELFWVVKHGIKMTGMPAWGVTDSDDELWSVVAFVNELPRVDAARYQQLLAQAQAREQGQPPAEQSETGLPRQNLPRQNDQVPPGQTETEPRDEGQQPF